MNLAKLGYKTNFVSIIPNGTLGDTMMDSLQSCEVGLSNIKRVDGAMGEGTVLEDGSVNYQVFLSLYNI